MAIRFKRVISLNETGLDRKGGNDFVIFLIEVKGPECKLLVLLAHDYFFGPKPADINSVE